MRLASLTFATLALLATSATAEPVRLTSTELDGVTGGLYRDVGIRGLALQLSRKAMTKDSVPSSGLTFSESLAPAGGLGPRAVLREITTVFQGS
jgi:hypothetical protein